MKLLFLASFILIFSPKFVNAQKEEYARSPVWIQMMNDTTANYFAVEKAYNTYWQHHEKPTGEDEEISPVARSAASHPVSRRQQRQLDAKNTMVLSIKKFEQWKMDVKPFVRPDGSILAPSERLRLRKQLKS